MTKPKNKTSWLLLLLAPMLLLQACATKSSDLMPVQPPQTPALPPSLAKPPPPESYLERAQSDIEVWRKALTNSEAK